MKPEDLDYLALGPGGCLDESQDLAQGESVRVEYYWDIWETVIDQALITDEHGNEYKLHQDGDVWLGLVRCSASPSASPSVVLAVASDETIR